MLFSQSIKISYENFSNLDSIFQFRLQYQGIFKKFFR